MSTGANPQRAFAAVRTVIHEWDPYGLLGSGEPLDEWDGEIASLVKQIPRIHSHNDAAHAVSRVFSSAFQPKGLSPEDCAEVGRRLYASLADAGLLTGGR